MKVRIDEVGSDKIREAIMSAEVEYMSQDFGPLADASRTADTILNPVAFGDLCSAFEDFEKKITNATKQMSEHLKTPEG